MSTGFRAYSSLHNNQQQHHQVFTDITISEDINLLDPIYEEGTMDECQTIFNETLVMGST